MRANHFPYFDGARPIAMAHRGGADYGPNAGLENSLTAFRNAVSLGYRYLETDVHATADGTVVAFHDPRLDRVTDASGAIADLPWSVVSQARIGGTEPAPTLDELLETSPTPDSTSTSKPTRPSSPRSRSSPGTAPWTACASARSRSVACERRGGWPDHGWRRQPGRWGRGPCGSLQG